MRLVQLARADERRVAVVERKHLRLLHEESPSDIYSLALEAIEKAKPLTALVEGTLGNEALDYDPVYEGSSPWRFLPSFDHPTDPGRVMVSGTGLTHKASAENRAAMHKSSAEELTDSMRMYQMGLEG